MEVLLEDEGKGLENLNHHPKNYGDATALGFGIVMIGVNCHQSTQNSRKWKHRVKPIIPRNQQVDQVVNKVTVHYKYLSSSNPYFCGALRFRVVVQEFIVIVRLILTCNT